jgi:type VII secretion integral membrane protein EccD
MAVAEVCRIAVGSYREDYSSTVDLVVPARLELGELMPCVVDLVGEQPDASGAGGSRQQWRLSRLDGSTLDESLTLQENGVRDGDLLLLTTIDLIPTPACGDLSDYVVEASARMGGDIGWARRLGDGAWLWSAGLGAASLVWPTEVAQDNRAVTAAIVAIAASVSAVIASRLGLEPSATLSIGMAAVAFGAVAGYLIVPGGPTPPGFFLAAAICSAMATVLLRVTACGSTLFTAITTFSLMVAIAFAVATVWPIPLAALGCFLAAASLAMLSGAAKVSIVVAGLSPRMPTAQQSDDDTIIPAAVGLPKATRGHNVLTGLLAGLSLAAALGATLVVFGGHSTSVWVRTVFAITVSAALMFRACQQRDAARSTSALLAGGLCVTAAFTSMMMSSPAHGAWICLIAVALGAAALCLTRVDLASRLSPLTRRSLEAVDYISLAAVVPMALWIGGVFDLVRGLSLT